MAKHQGMMELSLVVKLRMAERRVTSTSRQVGLKFSLNNPTKDFLFVLFAAGGAD